MAGGRTLTVTLTGDAKGALQAMGQVEGRSGRLGKALGDVSKIAAGFLAANVIKKGFDEFTGFVGGSVSAASDLGESLNAVGKIFGESAEPILKWGEQNATSFGLSQRAFNQMATPMGAILKNLGFEQDQVADQTINLTKRAADMASVFNTDVETALAAINSGLKGEANPLEQFGVGLSAAKVEAQALADTGKTVASSLTDQEKAQARLNLIFKETAATAGDFTDTAGEYANAQKISAARTEELQAKIGEKLIPVMQKITELKLALVQVVAERVVPALDLMTRWIGDNVVPVIDRLVERFQNDVLPVLRDEVVPVVERFVKDALGALVQTFEQDVLPKLQQFVGALRDHVIPAVLHLGNFVREKMFPPVKAFIDFLANNKEFLVGFAVAITALLVPAFVSWAVAAGAAGLATVVATAPIIAITAAIAALVGGIIWAIRHWDEISAAMGRFADFVTEKFTSFIGWLRDQFFAFLDSKFAWFALLLGPAGILVAVYKFRDEIVEAFEWVKDKGGDAWNLLADGVKGAANTIIGYANGVIGAFEAMVNGMGRAINAIPAFSIPGWVPDWAGGGQTFSLPHIDAVSLDRIPAFDNGGIVGGRRGQPQLVLAHGGETILPTHKRGGMAGAGIGQLHIHVDRPHASGAEIANEVMEALDELYRSGRIPGSALGHS